MPGCRPQFARRKGDADQQLVQGGWLIAVGECMNVVRAGMPNQRAYIEQLSGTGIEIWNIVIRPAASLSPANITAYKYTRAIGQHTHLGTYSRHY